MVIQENGTVEFVPNESNGEQNENDEVDSSTNHEAGTVHLIDVNQTSTITSTQDLPSLLPTIEEINAAQEHVENENQLQEHQEAQQTQADISGMHFEIHTDEHGQIVNIQQSLDGNGVVLADMGDLNISVSFRVS